MVLLNHWKDAYLPDIWVGNESMELFCVTPARECTVRRPFPQSPSPDPYIPKHRHTTKQLLEEGGYLFKEKSAVVGDNVLFPGARDFLAYVTATPDAPGRGYAGGRVSAEAVSSGVCRFGWVCMCVYLYVWVGMQVCGGGVLTHGLLSTHTYQRKCAQERRRGFWYRTEVHQTHLEYCPHIPDLVTVSVPV